MQLILAWVAFPLVLTALGAGWGVLVEKAAGRKVQGALLVAVGLMAALVVAAMMTASAATAPAAVAAVAVPAVVGLALAFPARRISLWPLLAAIGVLLVYGGPVLVTGHPTLAGYDVLDDTASWMGIVDQLFSHGRAIDLSPPSTYGAVMNGYLGSGYPAGGFMLLGVGRGLVGIDTAWVYQPYLALCGMLVGMSAYALLERFVASRPLRAGLAFVAAQPALLYGYSLAGSIKELGAAWVLMAGLALMEPYLGRAAPHPREAVVLALPAAALTSILGAGAVVWIALPFVALAASWGWAAWRDKAPRPLLSAGATLLGVAFVLALPAVLLFSRFSATDGALHVKPTGQPNDVLALGLLFAPLKLFQLAGIWPVRDFRLVAPTGPTAVLLTVLLASAIGAMVVAIRRREPTIVLYVAGAVLGIVGVKLVGSSPWVVAKAMAIGSPALLTAGLLGGALLIGRSRVAGALVCTIVAAGVLWSTALAFHGSHVAPYARFAELQKIGNMISGKGPTLLNEYEGYADRHFLRAGAPTGTGDFKTVPLTLVGGEQLGAGGFADLDSIPVQTILPYRTIVLGRSPTQSRPPSIYRLVWSGRWYDVWQRREDPADGPVPVVHIPGGDTKTLPFCGLSSKGPDGPCSVIPAAIPPCSLMPTITKLAQRAGADTRLVAYERPPTIVVRAGAGRSPAGWDVDAKAAAVRPTRPGALAVTVRIDSAQRYGLWIGGAFARATEVAVDGHAQAKIVDPRQGLWNYDHAGDVTLRPGQHTISLTYSYGGAARGPRAGPATAYFAVALDPLGGPPARMLDVAPSDAKRLCGRLLDWIEIVKPAA